MKVAAIVNWYGITDVADLLEGTNAKSYAIAWLASLANREEVARRDLDVVAPHGKLFLGAQPGNEPFFEACGFSPRPTGYNGRRVSPQPIVANASRSSICVEHLDSDQNELLCQWIGTVVPALVGVHQR